MVLYAEACFLVSVVLFALDGLGIAPGARLLSWGSAFFAAGFLTFALFLVPRDRRETAALRDGGPTSASESESESAGELDEDRQVSVDPNSLDPLDAERR
jgi:hypothetical protein